MFQCRFINCHKRTTVVEAADCRGCCAWMERQGVFRNSPYLSVSLKLLSKSLFKKKRWKTYKMENIYIRHINVSRLFLPEKKNSDTRMFTQDKEFTEHRRIDAFELWCWRRLLRVPWTARRSNQSTLKEISPECSLEGLMLKLKLQYFGHLM